MYFENVLINQICWLVGWLIDWLFGWCFLNKRIGQINNAYLRPDTGHESEVQVQADQTETYNRFPSLQKHRDARQCTN